MARVATRIAAEVEKQTSVYQNEISSLKSKIMLLTKMNLELKQRLSEKTFQSCSYEAELNRYKTALNTSLTTENLIRLRYQTLSKSHLDTLKSLTIAVEKNTQYEKAYGKDKIPEVVENKNESDHMINQLINNDIINLNSLPHKTQQRINAIRGNTLDINSYLNQNYGITSTNNKRKKPETEPISESESKRSKAVSSNIEQKEIPSIGQFKQFESNVSFNFDLNAPAPKIQVYQKEALLINSNPEQTNTTCNCKLNGNDSFCEFCYLHNE